MHRVQGAGREGDDVDEVVVADDDLDDAGDGEAGQCSVQYGGT